MQYNRLTKDFLKNPAPGILVFHYDIGSCVERAFVAYEGAGFADIQFGPIKRRRTIKYEDLLRAFQGHRFWDLENYNYSNVFDGHYYIAAVKESSRETKTLALSNPEMAESETINTFIRFLERDILQNESTE